MPTTTATASAAAPQHAPGRAAVDLNDARALGYGGFVEEVERRNVRRKHSATEEPASRSVGRVSSERGRASRRNAGKRGRGASNGRTKVSGAVSVGAAAATALLAAGGRSAATSGVRGLQMAMIKEAFARLDLDGDGYITSGDLGLAFRNMGRDATDRRLAFVATAQSQSCPALSRCVFYTIATPQVYISVFTTRTCIAGTLCT